LPFVSKAIGLPIAKIAAKVMAGAKLRELGVTSEVAVKHFSVKESVFPFNRFPGVDTALGPEMKSTGEVMGIDPDFGLAFAKSQFGAGTHLPTAGTVFISVLDQYKERIVPIARRLLDLGFNLCATAGTAEVLNASGVSACRVLKVHEGRPNVVDMIKNREISLIINTPLGRRGKSDSTAIRARRSPARSRRSRRSRRGRRGSTGLESLARGELKVLPCRSTTPARL